MYRNIDLDLLRTFIAVFETGSFSGAAKRVGRTQSAVSLQIKRLEELLKHNVLDRDNRNVELSTTGEILKDYAYKIIELNDETYLRISEAEISGVLKLGAPEVLTATHLSHILKSFQKEHPTIALDVTCKLSDELLHDYNKGEYDVVTFLRETQDQDSGTILYKEKLKWAQGKGVDFSGSRSVPLILSPAPCIYRKLAIEVMEKSKVEWRTVINAHSLSGRLSAVKNGLGIALIPEDMFDDDLIETSLAAEFSKCPDLELALLSQSKKDHIDHFIHNLKDYFRIMD